MNFPFCFLFFSSSTEISSQCWSRLFRPMVAVFLRWAGKGSIHHGMQCNKNKEEITWFCLLSSPEPFIFIPPILPLADLSSEQTIFPFPGVLGSLWSGSTHQLTFSPCSGPAAVGCLVRKQMMNWWKWAVRAPPVLWGSIWVCSGRSHKAHALGRDMT